MTNTPNAIPTTLSALAKRQSTPAVYAQSYARLGWLVLPIYYIIAGMCSCGDQELHRLRDDGTMEGSPGKHPRTKHGLKDATTDADRIGQWWDETPDANIAIRTGAESGLWTLDIDPDKGGNESLAALIEEHGPLPETLTAKTGGGGRHYCFHCPPDAEVRNHNPLLPGIDVRGNGGYIVAAPSNHISGGAYEWETIVEPAPAPAWLLALVTAPKSPPPTPPAPASAPAQNVNAGGDDYAHLLRRADAYVQATPTAGEGSRNNAVYTLAGNLAALDQNGLHLTESQVMEYLQVWNQGCTPPLPDHELQKAVKSAMSSRRAAKTKPAKSSEARAAVPTFQPDDPWPEIDPLPTMPPVMGFEYDLLPDAFRDYVADIADRMQCPPDFPAVTLMAGFGGVIGRRIGIRPKRQDNWMEVPNTWAAPVGLPSRFKSPAMAEPMSLLKRLEAELRNEFTEAMQQWKLAAEVIAARKEARKRDITQKLKGGQTLEEITEALQGDEPDPEPPVRRRLLTSDGTAEKLQDILAGNTHITLHRDELMGWIAAMSRAGREGERQFFLEGWNGRGEMTLDRMARGTIHSEGICISVVGGIQPGPLRRHLVDAAARGYGDDGLLQRFGLLVWPDDPAEWRNVDRWPDTKAKNKVWEIFQHWAKPLNPASIGAEQDEFDYPLHTPFLRFTPEAQQRFNEWRTQLEHLLRSDELPEMLQSHLGKYRGLIPQLALLCHLADAGCGPVALPSLERATRWAAYLRTHAERVYAPAVTGEVTDAALLLKKLKAKQQTEFTAREAHALLRTRTRYAKAAEVEPVLQILSAHNIIRQLAGVYAEAGGRPSIRYQIHPAAFRLSGRGPVTQNTQNPVQVDGGTGSVCSVRHSSTEETEKPAQYPDDVEAL